MSHVDHVTLTRKLLCAFLALLLVGVYGLTMVTSQAGAAGPLPAPTGLAPNGITAGPNPTLTWDTVTGAAYYRVTYPDNNGNPQTSTVFANAFAPFVDFPAGPVNWSVIAYDASNNPGASANASFTNQQGSAPTLTCPTSPVNFPAQSPVFNWTAVPGTMRYTLQVSTTNTFVPASTQTFTTQATSYTPTAGVPDSQTYYAKVYGTSANGINSSTSQICSYQVVWSAGTTNANDAIPTLKSPANHATVRDVILRWGALSGASSYEVQVSPNGDWTNNLLYDIVTDSTTWSPAKTLNNGSYFWRVRGIDRTGNFSRWSDYPSTSAGDAWQFTINPLAVPVPLSPVAESTIVNPDLKFSWKPVAGAGAYIVQFANNAGFSYINQGDLLNHTCMTNHTDWSPYAYENPPGQFAGPGGFGSCQANRPQQSPGYVDGTTIYWRVRAVDNYSAGEVSDPWNIAQFTTTNRPPYAAFVSDWSAPIRFFFNSAAPSNLQPTSGTVTVPTMSWSRVSGAQYYLVTVNTNWWTWDNGSSTCLAPTGSPSTRTYKTAALAFTPSITSSPRVSPQCPVNVSWTVQAVDWSNRTSPMPALRSFKWNGYSAPTSPTLSLLSPSPADGASTQDIPSFAWNPVTGADHYQVWWYDNPAGNVYVPKQDFNSGSGQMDPMTEAFTPVQPLPVGTGAWQVVALNASNQVIASSAKRTINVLPPSDVQLTSFTTRTQAGSAVTCTSGCTTPSTPLISWTTDPSVSYYRVFIAQDPNFTNILRTYDTEQNSIRPVEALPDNQAGQSYYVFVQPAKANWWTGFNAVSTIYGSGNSAVAPSKIWSFHKQSTAITGMKTLATNSTISASSVSACDDGTGVSTFSDVPTFCWNASSTVPYASGDLGAMSYHIQVSTTPDYSNIIDQAWVDQPSYTPYMWNVNDPNGGYNPQSIINPPNGQNIVHKTYPDGPIYWRVQAVDATGNGLTYGASQTLQKSSTAVSLNTPTNASTQGVTPSLSWDSKTFAARYEVQVARAGDTNFSNANMAFDQLTDLTSITPSNNNDAFNGTSLPAGTYAWRVRGVDANNNSGAWSSVYTFTIAPTGVTLLQPANNASFTTEYGLVFTWNQVPTAVRYRFFLNTTQTPSANPMIQSDTVSRAWSLDRQLPYTQTTKFYWQVWAIDGQGQTLSQSPVRSFNYDGTRPGATNQFGTNFDGSVRVSWSSTAAPLVGPISSFTIVATDTTNASGTKTVNVNPGTAVTPPGTGGAGSSTICSGTAPMNCNYLITGLRNADNYSIAITPNDANGPGITGYVNATPQRFAPFGNQFDCANWLYQDLTAKNPTSAQTTSYGSIAANSGCAAAAYSIWNSTEFQGMFAVARLYHAYFLRAPDNTGLRFWMNKRATPGTYWTLDHISSYFAGSTEFKNRYGTKSNSDFIKLIYANVLERPWNQPGDTGYSFWTGQLNSGKYTRGKVMTGFSEASEFKNKKMVQIKAEMLVLALYKRNPTTAEQTYYESIMPSTSGTASDVQAALRIIMSTQAFADTTHTNPMS